MIISEGGRVESVLVSGQAEAEGNASACLDSDPHMLGWTDGRGVMMSKIFEEEGFKAKRRLQKRSALEMGCGTFMVMAKSTIVVVCNTCSDLPASHFDISDLKPWATLGSPQTSFPGTHENVLIKDSIP
jgi:hypothetical protein